MIKSLFTAILGASLMTAVPSFATKEDGVLTFGIVPQQSASRLAKIWGPLIAELGSETGVSFRFQTTKDIPTFEYMNPMHYAIFSREADYRAIAHQSKKRLKGVIVARADSGIESLQDLGGAQVAFPSPGAFGASILTRSTLTGQGVDFEPNYVKSHDSVYRAVAAGLFPAGGGVSRTLNSVDPEIRAALKIVHETEGFTPHAIAVHSAVDTDMSAKIQAALLKLAAAHPELVKQIGMTGFELGEDGDWADVRALSMARDDTGILHAGDAACPSG